jgi:hypothetical protein
MADDIHDALAKTLADIRTRLGEGAFEDRRRVLALLSDMLPGANRQIRLLGIAIDNGAVRAIATSRQEQAALEIDRHAQRVDADLGIRKAIMVPVLRAVAYAVGRGFLPSTYAPEAASEVVVRPAAREEEWVGLADETPPAPAPAVPKRASAPPPPAPRAPAPSTPRGSAPPPPPPDLRIITAPPPAAARAPAPVQAAGTVSPRTPAPAPAPTPATVSPRAAVAAPAPAPVPAPPAPAPAQPPLAPQPPPGAGPNGLGGWLIAWTLWLGLSIVGLGLFGVALCSRLLDILFSDESVIIREGIVVLPFLLLAVAALGIVVLWLHVRRSRRARFAYPLWLTAVACLPLYADGLRLTAITYDIVRLQLWLIALPLVLCVGGWVYFMRSRRAHNTFLR